MTNNEMLESEIDDPRVELVQTKLDRAKGAFASNNPTEAQRFFAEALGVSGIHPDRVSNIRWVVELYCEQQTEEHSPPDWDKAIAAFQTLVNLELADNPLWQWGQTFQMKYAEFLLQDKQFEAGFEIFKTIREKTADPQEENQLREKISDQVRTLISQQLASQQWSQLEEITKQFVQLWPNENELHKWLDLLAETFTTAQTHTETIQAELQEKNRTLQMLEATTKNNKIYIGGLVVLLGLVLAIAFILIVLFPVV